MLDRFLRVPEVLRACGFKRTTLYRMIESGEFPQPRQITGGLTGFLESEVNEWMRSRPVGKKEAWWTTRGELSPLGKRRALEAEAKANGAPGSENDG